jgi:hypothetical protein
VSDYWCYAEKDVKVVVVFSTLSSLAVYWHVWSPCLLSFVFPPVQLPCVFLSKIFLGDIDPPVWQMCPTHSCLLSLICINTLMPELNPSEQGCLPEIFYCDFKFCWLLLGKRKAYLVDFSFRFNEIKCCTLLMNWLIGEKIFTYFCNKFRPVNRMHYIKCGVNSSLLT